jgi:rhamnosyltransferase
VNTAEQCSVVIRAFNEEKNIGRVLQGIKQQSVKQVEIILVDSGSTDATINIAKKFGVEVISIPPESFSFGYSLNCGITTTSNEYVVIASAHVYPLYSDWLERLLAPFNDPQIALTYGKQRGNENTHFSEHQVFTQWYPEQSVVKQRHPFCNNANAAIRRDLWKIHPYDETLSGLEDIEWAHYMIGLGYSIAYVADAEVIHVHNETPRKVYNRYRREAMAFKRIFPEERFGILDFFRLCLTNIASDIWHASQQRKLVHSLRSILWFRTMQFWGTYQGFQHSGPLTSQLRKTFYYPRGLNPGKRLNEKRKVKPVMYNDDL